MFNLCKAHDNTMNYIILENLDSGLSIIVDWDLSEDEISALVEKFDQETGLDESLIYGEEWEADDSVYAHVWDRERLA